MSTKKAKYILGEQAREGDPQAIVQLTKMAEGAARKIFGDKADFYAMDEIRAHLLFVEPAELEADLERAVAMACEGHSTGTPTPEQVLGMLELLSGTEDE